MSRLQEAACQRVQARHSVALLEVLGVEVMALRGDAMYISGKMTGLPDKGKAAFAEAEEYLRKMGFVVLNPAVLPDGLDGNRYMPMCIAMIDAADAVVMLDGWEDSPGARLEKAYAEYQRIPVHIMCDIQRRSCL